MHPALLKYATRLFYTPAMGGVPPLLVSGHWMCTLDDAYPYAKELRHALRKLAWKAMVPLTQDGFDQPFAWYADAEPGQEEAFRVGTHGYADLMPATWRGLRANGPALTVVGVEMEVERGERFGPCVLLRLGGEEALTVSCLRLASAGGEFVCGINPVYYGVATEALEGEVRAGTDSMSELPVTRRGQVVGCIAPIRLDP